MRYKTLILWCALLCACTTTNPTTSNIQESPLVVDQQGLQATVLSTPTRAAYAWLEDVACRPPCWEDITPGQTTQEQALMLLEGNSFFTSVTLQTDRSGAISGTIYARYLETSDTRIYFHPNSSQIYAIQNKFPNITLSDIVAKLGEPTHVFAYFVSNPEIIEEGKWEIRIIWLNQGTEMVASGNDSVPDISANLRFNQETSFFIPTVEGYEDNLRLNTLDGYLREWTGYNTFHYYSSGTFP